MVSRFRFAENQKNCDSLAGELGGRLRDMRLNLVCGFNMRDGFVNVDIGDHCAPDVVNDL